MIRRDGKPVLSVDVLDQLGAVVNTAPSGQNLRKAELLEQRASRMRSNAKEREAHIKKLREARKQRRQEYLEETEKQPYVH